MKFSVGFFERHRFKFADIFLPRAPNSYTIPEANTANELNYLRSVPMSFRQSTISVSDMRDILGIASPTMNDLCRKLDVNLTKQSTGARSKNLSPADARKILENRGFQFPKEAKVISYLVCKGGTSKSTCSFFSSLRLSSFSKVLVIDGDPQGNLSSAFQKYFDQSSDKENGSFSLDEDTRILVDVLDGDVDISEAIIKLTPNLHLIPSTPLNSVLENSIRENYKNHSLALRTHLDKIKKQYDFIIIDSAPALNLTNMAIICASSQIVLPLNTDKFSEIALSQTLNEIEQIQNEFKIKNLDVRIAITRVDGREYINNSHFISRISERNEKKIFNTTIATSTDCKRAIQEGDDLFTYSRSRAKEDFCMFTRELIGLDKFKKSDRAGAKRK